MIKKIGENHMNEELILVIPTKEYEAQAMNLIDEVNKTDLDENTRFAGFSSLEKYRDKYDDWLILLSNNLNTEKLKEGRVTSNTFFTIRKEDNKVVGIINIRHELNEYLFNYGGHIGYSVLPSERRKGYAYKQLLLGLDFCKKLNIKKVLITCVDYNMASSKTIERAGGVLENIVFNPIEKINQKRYWINI